LKTNFLKKQYNKQSKFEETEMKEKLIKGIQKNITKMVEVSRQGLTEQQCLIDLSQLSFNFVSSEWFWRMQFPVGSIYHSDFMVQELTNYKQDTEAWELLQTITQDYWQLVKLCEPFTDVMHLIGYSSKTLSKAMGQFLTPPAVADGLNRLTTTIPDLQGDRHITVGDFGGCGAGSLLLGWLRHAHSLHPTRLSQVHMFGVDIDQKMVRMTALQIILSCLAHDIQLGSLSLHCCHAIIDYRHYAFGSTKFLTSRFTTNQFNYEGFQFQLYAEHLKEHSEMEAA
jgi:hypothetical protein